MPSDILNYFLFGALCFSFGKCIPNKIIYIIENKIGTIVSVKGRTMRRVVKYM
jgi:hypothetical protein